jgi:hypothetical protein|tara:strand:+ start:4013 stop:4813 length:801 start_codon:yes stop_codon:yes gene_type:complete
MDNNLKNKLHEELKRFNNIGNYVKNLEEQIVLGTGRSSGFVEKQGNSPRVIQFAQRQEMGEQEEVAPEEELAVGDEEVADEELAAVGDEEVAAVGDEEVAVGDEAVGAEEEGDAAVEDELAVADTGDTDTEDTVEVDVTDLVDKQKEIETAVKSSEENISGANDKLSSLLDKLDELEGTLADMDSQLSKIETLEKKIEQFRPRTAREKVEQRKDFDSGPYNTSLSDFWQEGQERFKKQGKEEYVLTPDEAKDYSETDIQQSFNPPS